MPEAKEACRSAQERKLPDQGLPRRSFAWHPNMSPGQDWRPKSRYTLSQIRIPSRYFACTNTLHAAAADIVMAAPPPISPDSTPLCTGAVPSIVPFLSSPSASPMHSLLNPATKCREISLPDAREQRGRKSPTAPLSPSVHLQAFVVSAIRPLPVSPPPPQNGEQYGWFFLCNQPRNPRRG